MTKRDGASAKEKKEKQKFITKLPRKKLARVSEPPALYITASPKLITTLMDQEDG